MDSNTATRAAEYQSRIGQDLVTGDFEDEEYVETGEESGRWEKEGRAEMYATLFGDALGY